MGEELELSPGGQYSRRSSPTARTWRIVAEARKEGGGATSIGHTKFRMLLDYLAVKNPGQTRAQLYDFALDGSWGKLTSLSWQDMHDELAREGVPGYELLVRKKKGGSRFDAFSDVLED